MNEEYFGGLDFGTSGARISIIDKNERLIYQNSNSYKFEFKNPSGWEIACLDLLSNIPNEIKDELRRLSISGTSGTLVACSLNGIHLGNSIPYDEFCSVNENELKDLSNNNPFLNNPYSSLAKALKFLEIHGNNILLRHQSDWISGWIMGSWIYGEEGNNIKLGWDITSESWPKTFDSISWRNCLPIIIKSGYKLGKINTQLARELNISENLDIIAGTTDSNASFLASEINNDEGLTVLGTTMVLKKFIKKPFNHPGVTIHKVNGELICGGASNAGCGILSKFFTDLEIEELSRQINPSKKTNLNFLPLNSKGERFPNNDPFLEPLLEPRPISDALFLQGLFEGLARIELNGWEKLRDLSGTFPKKIITTGGGSKNPQWKSIREKILKVPIISRDKSTSLGAALLALHAKR